MSSSSLFFSTQNDTLLSFLTVEESLTYTALLTLQKRSKDLIKKKVCILSSSTRQADVASCDAFTSNTCHPELCFKFIRFCSLHYENWKKSSCWGGWCKVSGAALQKACDDAPENHCCAGTKLSCPKLPAVTAVGDAAVGIEASSPSPAGKPNPLCTGNPHGEQRSLWNYSGSCWMPLISQNSFGEHWSHKPFTRHFLDKNRCVSALVKFSLSGLFWQKRLDISDQRLLMLVPSLTFHLVFYNSSELMYLYAALFWKTDHELCFMW